MAKNCVCSGELRERVTLQMAQRARDAVGGFSEQWLPQAEVWARVQPMGAGERFWRQQIEAKADWRVSIRYRSDVTTKLRVRWGNRLFQIRGVTNPDERKVFLDLACEELAAP